ncbi:metalloregulator ArsR/SmtB family transcription factor [Desulfovibrio aminophilus]|nr:metalloregulator ArsR/SmtB family transcription factor [Desulfovibrio aminophilus]MCM0755175.1 metalloregulator ArsR/SmtB family transcription factor [Desulfovibrio aminophilus]
MRTFLKVMRAMSDPGRVKALKLLEGGELCVCRIQESLGLAQPTVSRHLRRLVEAGLVQNRKKGPWVYYRLADEPRPPMVATALANLRHWLNEDEDVRQALELLARTYETHPEGEACPRPEGK